MKSVLMRVFGYGVLGLYALSQTPALEAKIFEVSTAAQFQAALNEAAVNGEDDIIRLAAGTYRTTDNQVETLEFNTSSPPTPASASTVKLYGKFTLTPPESIPFVYRPRFDDDIAGQSRCPMSSGELCKDTNSLTIEGAGEGQTLLLGDGTSPILNIDLAIYRSQESVDREAGYVAGPGNVYAPDFVANASGQFSDIAQQPVIATIPTTINDAQMTITVKNLTIENGALPEVVFDSQDSERYYQQIYFNNCVALMGYNRIDLDPIRIALWVEDTCTSGGLNIFTNQGSAVVENVTFKNNRSATRAGPSGGGLAASTFGGSITLKGSTFLGNRAERDNLAATQVTRGGGSTGGGASLVTFFGAITVEDSIFGDGTEAGVNVADTGGGGLYAMIGPALEWDDRADALIKPPSATFDPLAIERFNQTNEGEPFPPAKAIGNKLVVRNSQFNRNISGYGGGAVLISHYGHQGVEVSDSSFLNNTAGYAWQAEYNSILYDLQFSKGAAGLELVAKSGEVLVTDSVFEYNLTKYIISPSDPIPQQSGGLRITSEHPVTVSNSRFAYNEVTCPEQFTLARCTDRSGSGGAEIRGIVNFIENEVMYNSAAISGGVHIIGAGSPPGSKLRVSRNRIQSNEGITGAGITIIAPHQDVEVSGNYIADNISSQAQLDYGGGLTVRTLSGAISVVHNTIRNNVASYLPGLIDPSGTDRSAPSGGAWITAEFSEPRNMESNRWEDNLPNFDAAIGGVNPEYELPAGSMEIINNNFWNNQIVDATPQTPDAAGTQAASIEFMDLIIDNLVKDESDDRLGAVSGMDTNNFTESGSFRFVCPDDMAFTCEIIAQNNISVDPGFQNDDDGLLLPTSPLIGAQAPTNNLFSDFYGIIVSAIGAFWFSSEADLPLAVPTLSGLGLIVLGLIMLWFSRRRVQA